MYYMNCRADTDMYVSRLVRLYLSLNYLPVTKDRTYTQKYYELKAAANKYRH